MPINDSESALTQPEYNLDTRNNRDQQLKKVAFVDGTIQSGITTPHSQKSAEITGIHESLGSGVCIFDVNNDGWLDVLILLGTGKTHYFGKPKWWQKSNSSVSLFINERNGTFSNQTKETGLVSKSVTIGCAIGDLDADGDQDIFLANRGRNEVWENIDGRSFRKHSNFNLSSDRWSTSATIADFNNDGLLDIYVTNYLDFQPNSNTFEASAGFTEEKTANFDPNLHAGVANELLINKSNFKFEDMAQSLGVSNSQGRGLASTTVDTNNDGWLDLLIANDSNSENKLYTNTSRGFKDVSTKSQLGIISRTSSVQIANIESDTKNSVLIHSGNTKFNRVLSLTENSENESFVDKSDNWRLNTLSGVNNTSWASAIADFNMDGWQDVLVANGSTHANSDTQQLSQAQPSYLLTNKQGIHFERQNEYLGSPALSLESSRCAVAGDFNNDGYPDALIAKNNGLAQMLINMGNDANWIGLIFRNINNNRLPIGAQIELITNQRSISKIIQNGTHGFCWQDNSHFSISLREKEVPIKAIIRHRDKTIGTYKNLRIGEYNLFDSNTTQKIAKTTDIRSSEIALKSPEAKAMAIALLESLGRHTQAYSELLIMLNDKELKSRKAAVELFDKFPKKFQEALIPSLLQSKDKTMVKEGLNLIHRLEDDRLARWLFGVIKHADDDISCHAMVILQDFYAEEEAMILSKYAGLNLLLENLDSKSESRQSCSIRALGESERYKAVAPLVNRLESASNAIKQDIIVALGRIRDRDALPLLHQRFLDETETPSNRLFTLQSIKQIDSSFNGLDAVLKALEGDNRSVYLHTVSLLFDKHSNLPTFETKRKISKSVYDWHVRTRPQLNASEKINYFRIIKDHYPLPMKELIELSQINDDGIKLSALVLLSTLDSTQSKQYLTKILSLIETRPTSLPHLIDLPDKHLFEIVNSTFGNLQPEITLALFTHLSKQSKQQILVQLLQNQTTEVRDHWLEIFLNQFSPKPTEEFCEPLNYLFENTERNLEAILILDKFSDMGLIQACYNNQNPTKEIKGLIDKLNAQAKLKPLAFKLFAQRQDRWARELTLEFLEGKTVSTEDKLHIIEALRLDPFPSQKNALQRIFDNDTSLIIANAAAQKLAKMPQWIEQNKENFFALIDRAIQEEDEKIAIELLKTISISYPDRALDYYFASPNPHTRD